MITDRGKVFSSALARRVAANKHMQPGRTARDLNKRLETRTSLLCRQDNDPKS